MSTAAQRFEFAPPPQPGLGRALGLAAFAHLLLLAALTWGVTWKHEASTLSAEAELWSAQPQMAAPPLEQPPPSPPPPAPVVEPVTPPPPALSEAAIAVEREKKRAALDKQKREAEAKKKALADKKRLDDKKKREEQEKAAKAQSQQQAQARAREEAEAKRAEALREDNLRRMQGLAGATGAQSATGNATRASGPSDSYAGRIRARIKPNIVFSDDLPGNPATEVEVRLAPDGTITDRRVTKPSGFKAWDDAVLRALDRTAVLPRDADGRVHSPLLLTFRLRD